MLDSSTHQSVLRQNVINTHVAERLKKVYSKIYSKLSLLYAVLTA